MPRSRGTASVTLSVLLSASLLVTPIWGSSDLGLGTVVSAERAVIGTAGASTGATIFAGDKLTTDSVGTLQVRAGAARLLLRSSSQVIWNIEQGSPTAILTSGTAAFSTANAKAFVLHAGTAAFRPLGDEPTVANVTLLNAKELVVRCTRGALTIAVEDDIRVIPEGSAYHVVLDPSAQPPAGIPAAASWSDPWGQHQPTKSGTSKFLWYAIGFTALITGFAVYKALESPDKPNN
jgi:hypothetical protein